MLNESTYLKKKLKNIIILDRLLPMQPTNHNKGLETTVAKTFLHTFLREKVANDGRCHLL